VLTTPHEAVIAQRAIPLGVTTNGVAEYRALIAGLAEAHSLGVTHLRVFSDSEFMVRQMQGRYKARTPAIIPLLREAVKLRGKFEGFKIQHVPRERNNLADGLAGQGATLSAQGQVERLDAPAGDD
jgi:ribonuclease HI